MTVRKYRLGEEPESDSDLDRLGSAERMDLVAELSTAWAGDGTTWRVGFALLRQVLDV